MNWFAKSEDFDHEIRQCFAETLVQATKGELASWRSTISDALYQRASQVFSEQELCDVIFFIAQINAWNRLGVAFHTEIGSMDKMMGLDDLQL